MQFKRISQINIQRLAGVIEKSLKKWGGVLTCGVIVSVGLSFRVDAYELITAQGLRVVSTTNDQRSTGRLSRKNRTKNKSSCFQKNKYQSLILEASQKYGIDPKLVKAVISAESCFNPKAVSSKGAQGLMQLMPFTAKRFGVTNSFDPYQNIVGGVKYLRFLSSRYKNNLQLTLAAYNSGEGAVEKFQGIPPYKETRAYVKRVLVMMKMLNTQTIKQKTYKFRYVNEVGLGRLADSYVYYGGEFSRDNLKKW